ncbi:hypothetical protein B0T18DRAFT_440120 [Schizothecium vesticola]|uniref:Putative lipoate-protein ligase A n=1 Tax=Schizothecium vesticola TaxID=314040 RepID=A0AA40EJE8_9PEZI|nr:hypothetical protein B0T18DRAFT_440120 [Schizothecium vesticola]
MNNVLTTPKPHPPPSLSHPQSPPSPRTYTTASLARPLQIYRSTTTNPHLNLSIEHDLLTRSAPTSTVLFLYTNRPSIILGRNQNPWLEVHHPLLRRGLPGSQPTIDLLRRRSGGGTVFHDLGNANWTVICPPAVFDRDRHAEMVARALQRLGVATARVNERHDIVVDSEAEAGGTYKVSGSAYKLTRLRALHHGTCLLGSENLGRVGALLRAPGAGYIKARGVESVRSAICNVGVGRGEFEEAVGVGVEEVGEEMGEVEVVAKGWKELMSPEWVYGQTPLFTFSTCPTEEDPRERPPLPRELPAGKLQTNLTLRHGVITSASITGLFDSTTDKIISERLVGRNLFRSPSTKDLDVDGGDGWASILSAAVGSASSDSFATASARTDSVEALGKWLDGMLPVLPLR